MARVTKKDIYNQYGIEYKAGKINAPLFGWIEPLLCDGNEKLGKGVFTWSMLPANKTFNVKFASNDCMEIKGTCPCNCTGCYAQTGRYNYGTVLQSNARKTAIARMYPDFIQRAIIAQIKADNVKMCRIHAAGDFFSDEYIQVWKNIAIACPDCIFWTYTKYGPAENAFNDVSNVNVVKSIIPCVGFNFGHCDYIADAYKKLIASGESVYICRCGIDKNQHCNNCKGCSTHKYVLFIEHSTGYNAETDPAFDAVKELVDAQAN